TPDAPAATPVAPTTTPATEGSAGDPIADAVVSIVSGLTGYPPELLDVDLDLEADLGVDTVKQAEVFAAVRERFGIQREDDLRLRDFPTLAHVIAWVRDRAGARTAPAAGGEAAAVTAAGPAMVAGDLAATDRY